MGLRPEPLDRGSIMVARGRLGCLLLMLMASRTTATTSAWDCTNGLTTAMPIQAMNCGPQTQPPCLDTSTRGFGFYALNVEDGSYSPLFTISNNALDYSGGPYPTALNACGISPNDSRAYCVVGVKDSQGVDMPLPFLIRLGSSHANPNVASFEYVAKLRGSGNQGTGTVRPNSAAFTTNGTFHFSFNHPAPDKINILGGTRMPHLLEGFSDPTSVDLADFRNVMPVSGDRDFSGATLTFIYPQITHHTLCHTRSHAYTNARARACTTAHIYSQLILIS